HLSLWRTVGPGTTLRKAAIHRDHRDRRRGPCLGDSARSRTVPLCRRLAQIGVTMGNSTQNHRILSPGSQSCCSTLAISASRPRDYGRSCRRQQASPRTPPTSLLEFHLGAGLLQLSLDFLGLVFAHAFLDRLGGALDQILGLLETEASERAHLFDHLDL